jgi:protein TonB
MEISVPHYIPPPPNYRRTVGFGVVVLLHVVVIYMVQSGLGKMMVDKLRGPMEAQLVEEIKAEKEEPPPPPPKFQAPPPVYVAMPEIAITETAPTNTITTTDRKPEAAPPPVAKDVVIGPRTNPRRPNSGADEIYPTMSRRLGEEGSVILLLTVDETGKVTKADIKETSGFERLDDAASKEAVRSWRFLPGTVNGKATAMQMPLKVTFKIPK